MKTLNIGDNRVWWGYSLEDINAIANFDFTKHPFIPRTTNQILRTIFKAYS
jgi:hypothetical protein